MGISDSGRVGLAHAGDDAGLRQAGEALVGGGRRRREAEGRDKRREEKSRWR